MKKIVLGLLLWGSGMTLAHGQSRPAATGAVLQFTIQLPTNIPGMDADGKERDYATFSVTNLGPITRDSIYQAVILGVKNQLQLDSVYLLQPEKIINRETLQPADNAFYSVEEIRKLNPRDGRLLKQATHQYLIKVDAALITGAGLIKNSRKAWVVVRIAVFDGASRERILFARAQTNLPGFTINVPYTANQPDFLNAYYEATAKALQELQAKKEKRN